MELQDRMNARKDGCRAGWNQDRMDTRQDGRRRGWMQERMAAGQDGSRTGWAQSRRTDWTRGSMDAGQYGLGMDASNCGRGGMLDRRKVGQDVFRAGGKQDI